MQRLRIQKAEGIDGDWTKDTALVTVKMAEQPV